MPRKRIEEEALYQHVAVPCESGQPFDDSPLEIPELSDQFHGSLPARE